MPQKMIMILVKVTLDILLLNQVIEWKTYSAMVLILDGNSEHVFYERSRSSLNLKISEL